ncbi:phage head closure protein [Variovorax boronicumulans]|uniref:phage head closure protein n=1 Tax=Variovorax boronicumulans TaxID=436515 RepID=UPI001C55EE10
MLIGPLSSRITIQRLQLGQDDVGQPSQAWADVASVWANVRYLSGVETVKSEAPVSVARASIRIRRRTDVSANMRVVFGSTIFDIKAVLPDEESRERLDLACETGANLG